MAITAHGAVHSTDTRPVPIALSGSGVGGTLSTPPALAAWWDKNADRPSVAATRSPLEH